MHGHSHGATAAGAGHAPGAAAGAAAVDLDSLLEWSRGTDPHGGTATLMPVLCLQCGMPLNNVQDAYERVMQEAQPAGRVHAAFDADPDFQQRLYKWLHKTRLCCRVNLSRSAADSRLRFAAPFTSTFVEVRRESKAQAPPVVVHTDGTTRIYEAPPKAWLE